MAAKPTIALPPQKAPVPIEVGSLVCLMDDIETVMVVTRVEKFPMPSVSGPRAYLEGRVRISGVVLHVSPLAPSKIWSEIAGAPIEDWKLFPGTLTLKNED